MFFVVWSEYQQIELFSFLGIVGLNNIKANDYLNVVLQVKKCVTI